jgi:hypothetical protein
MEMGKDRPPTNIASKVAVADDPCLRPSRKVVNHAVASQHLGSYKELKNKKAKKVQYIAWR